MNKYYYVLTITKKLDEEMKLTYQQRNKKEDKTLV